MQHIKKIYLYAVSLISLVMIVIAAVILINMALKTWVFTKADNNAFYPPICSEPAVNDPTISALKPGQCNPGMEEQQKQIEKENRAAQKQRDAAQALAMILVATPVFYYHWRLARKE